MSIKKVTNYDNEVERKSTALEKLKIDASSFDSVKHVKGLKFIFIQSIVSLVSIHLS